MKGYKTMVTGLTSPVKIPYKIKSIPHSQVREAVVLKVSDKPYSVTRILNIDIKLNVNNYNVKELEDNCDVIIRGYRDVTINYVSKESINKLHQLKYKIPFDTSIKYPYKDVDFKKLYAVVEKVDIKTINEKKFKLDTKLFLAPIIDNVEAV